MSKYFVQNGMISDSSWLLLPGNLIFCDSNYKCLQLYIILIMFMY